MKQTFLYAVWVILVTAFSGCAGMNFPAQKQNNYELIYSKALEYYQKNP